MPHHFLYLKNAYHILITKPSLPHLYLYYIQKLARKLRAISPKLARTTAKNGRFLVGAGAAWSGVGTLGSPASCPPHRIQKISAQFARYFPKLPSKRATLAPYPVMICSGSRKSSTTITSSVFSSVLRKM